jgi:hypothetical protein
VADFAPYRDRENVASKINYGNDSSKSDSQDREFVHPPSCAFAELSTIAFGEADPPLANVRWNALSSTRWRSKSRLCRLNSSPRGTQEDRVSHLAPSEKPIHLSQKRRRWNALSKALGTAPGRDQKSVPCIQVSSSQRLQLIPSSLRFARFHWQRQRNATVDLLHQALLDR